jgi:cytoskeletal protein RodZ
MTYGDGKGGQDPSERPKVPWYHMPPAVVAAGMLAVLVIGGILFAVVQTANHSSRPRPAVPTPMTTATTTTTSSESTTSDVTTSDTTSSETTPNDTNITSTTTATTDESPPASVESPNRKRWKQFLLFGGVVVGLLLAALMDRRRHTKQSSRDRRH